MKKVELEFIVTDEIIKRKTGSYGRVNIILPLSTKQSILSWMEKSGMNKAQFFRTALLIGSVQLAEQLGVKEQSNNHFVSDRCEFAQQHDRR